MTTREEFVNFLRAKQGRTCEACGANDWLVPYEGQGLRLLLMNDENEIKLDTGTPTIVAVCRNCGNIDRGPKSRSRTEVSDRIADGGTPPARSSPEGNEPFLLRWGVGIRKKLADHAFIPSVQSMISSWSAATVGVFAIMFSAIGFLAIFTVYSAQRIDGQLVETQKKIETARDGLQQGLYGLSTKFERDSQRTDQMGQDLQTLNGKVDGLASQVGIATQRIEGNLQSLTTQTARSSQPQQLPKGRR